MLSSCSPPARPPHLTWQQSRTHLGVAASALGVGRKPATSPHAANGQRLALELACLGRGENAQCGQL